MPLFDRDGSDTSHERRQSSSRTQSQKNRSNPRILNRIRPAWTDRNFLIVWYARVFMSAGRALAGVVAPIYLAERGLSGLKLGEIFVVVALLSAIFSTIVGVLSDRVGRRPFLIIFPLLTALAGLVFALSSTTILLVLAAGMGSFGRGAGAGAGAVGPYQPAESALVTEIISDRWRNAAFGRLAFGSALGALLGSLLATLSNGHVQHGVALIGEFRIAFFATAIVSLIAAFLALFIHEPTRPIRPISGEKRSKFPVRSRTLLMRLWATNSVNGLAVGMIGPFITYWFYKRYGATPASIGLLFAIVNLFTLVSTLSAAGLARRWGLIKIVVAVRTLQAILLVPMALAPNFLLAGGIYLVRMVVQRAGMPLRQSYVLAMADPQERASVAAISNVPTQIAMGVGPMVTGYLFDEVSLSLPFELAGLLQLINAGMYWVFFRNLPPSEELDAQNTSNSDRVE